MEYYTNKDKHGTRDVKRNVDVMMLQIIIDNKISTMPHNGPLDPTILKRMKLFKLSFRQKKI
jgi:hypothetical protein